MVKSPKQIQVRKTIEVTDFYEIDHFIETLQEFPKDTKIEGFELKYYDQGPVVMNVWYYRDETEAEKLERVAAAKALQQQRKVKQAQILAAEREQYKRLKAKFEGETS